MKEMQDAVAYVKSIGGVDSIEPLGVVCPKVFAKDAHQQFKKDPTPKQMAFSATIGSCRLNRWTLQGCGGPWNS